MFRNDVQRGTVCMLLCRWIPKSPWKDKGDGYRPTDKVCVGKMPDGLSTGELAMIRLSVALWKGDDLVVWQGFDRTRMTDVGELLVALSSSSAIDAWIRRRAEPGVVEIDVRPRIVGRFFPDGGGPSEEIDQPAPRCASCGDSGVDVMGDGSSRPCHCRGGR